MNNKRARFVRLAESRVNNTIKNIDLISNLSNTNNYAYTEQDIKKIFRTIKQHLSEAEKKFILVNKETQFKL